VDDLAEAVLAYERSALAEPIKVALRLTDAFLANPAGLTEDKRREVLACFTPGQVVELTMKFVFATVNKPAIALGFDSAIDKECLSTFEYDADGHFIVQGLGAVNRATG
jgi:hypothetical protein